MTSFLSGLWTSVIEYETPRLVRIHNRKLGLVRRLIQASIVGYVCLYALWLQRGYQEFCAVEASITVKIKGVTKSQLRDRSKSNEGLYTRVWDVADYVIPPAENGAFFVATNVIITANQTRGFCPEDHTDVQGVVCEPSCIPFPVMSNADMAENSKITSNKNKISIEEENIRSSNDTLEYMADDYNSDTNSSAMLFSRGEQIPLSQLNNWTTSEIKESWKLKNPSRHKRKVEKDILTSSNLYSDGTIKNKSLFYDNRDMPIMRHPYGNNTVRCVPINQSNCEPERYIFKAHGPQTGMCVSSDRPKQEGVYTCEVESWCPIEVDELPIGLHGKALMGNAAGYTVFIKNSVAFPYFGKEYVRNNLVKQTCKELGNGTLVCKNKPCLYERGKGGTNIDDFNNGCQIFELGKMVEMAGGNFSEMAVKGGVVSLSISWNCDLDLDFMDNCLPKYSFRILEETGYNFRHAKYHEENRRTLYKMYGIKFLLTVDGRGGQFNLKNTILNIGSGLALLGVTTIVCDFLLMYIRESGMVKQKKYDYIDLKGRKRSMNSSLFPDKPRLTQSENDLSPNRVNPKSTFTIIDSTTEAAKSKTSLRLNLRGVKKFMSSNGGHEKSYKPSGCQKAMGCHNHAPSSYSSHHLLQSPEAIEEETILTCYPDQAATNGLEDKDMRTVAEVIKGHDPNIKDAALIQDFGCDQDIQSKDFMEPVTPISAYEHPIGSLEISMDEKKFLGDGSVSDHPTTILNPGLLSVYGNNIAFPDIDHEGSIETFSNYGDNEGISSTLTLDSNDNRNSSRERSKHFRHLASFDDI